MTAPRGSWTCKCGTLNIGSICTACSHHLHGPQRPDPWAHRDGTAHSADGPRGCYGCANVRTLAALTSKSRRTK